MRYSSLFLVLFFCGCTSSTGGVVVSTAQVDDGRLLARTCHIEQSTIWSFGWILNIGAGELSFRDCKWSVVKTIDAAGASNLIANRKSEEE